MLMASDGGLIAAIIAFPSRVHEDNFYHFKRMIHALDCVRRTRLLVTINENHLKQESLIFRTRSAFAFGTSPTLSLSQTVHESSLWIRSGHKMRYHCVFVDAMLLPSIFSHRSSGKEFSIVESGCGTHLCPRLQHRASIDNESKGATHLLGAHVSSIVLPMSSLYDVLLLSLSFFSSPRHSSSLLDVTLQIALAACKIPT